MPVVNSRHAPLLLLRPMAPFSVNHILPSGPSTMLEGPAPGVTPNSVTLPDGEITPILSTAVSVNQTLPSGPAAMPAVCETLPAEDSPAL